MSHVISQTTAKLLKQQKKQQQLEQAHHLGIRILSQADPDYPTMLCARSPTRPSCSTFESPREGKPSSVFGSSLRLKTRAKSFW